ncbi:MAG: isopeptide-forming domain-containing fimbrial protein [Erysipelotrichaceae bacterium]|nr:isopeptide-forming domain-containing fimbrial protein [Erysipelotrichaceae bacterium]
MKLLKKLMVVFVAVLMVMSLATRVMAEDGEADTVTITVNRDSSYGGEATDAGRTFTWYKIFTAVPAEDFESSNASGHTDGVANVATGDGQVSYYATAAVATALADSGNIWFDVQAISGSDLSVITWKEGVDTDAETLQAAAKWLVANNAYEDTGSMTFANGAWTAEVEKGYYVLSSDTGDNVIAATTDITVNEKNDYPPIVKEEEDEDNITIVDTDTGEALNVAIGDSIDYTVTVTIPAAAKVGETIEVWDKPSKGLTYNNDLVVTPATDVTDGTLGTGEIWHKIITVTAVNKGTDIVFAYSMTINDDALVDTDRMNEATLKYGNEYESLPHSVEYTTYFTGIIKTNSDEEPLEGVKFDLFEDGVAFNVTKTADGYYIPAGADVVGATNEVVTDADGLIKIRGLDDDKTYTLTETYTLPGYNMLKEDVTLTLTEDKDTAFADMTADEYQPVVNQSGTVLPSTGGIGTTIFHVAGAALVLGAGIILVSKKRVNG